MVLRTTEVQGTEQAGPSLKGEKSTCRCLSYTPGRPGGILCWDSRTAGALPGQQSTPDPSSLGLPPKNCPRWRSPKHTLPSRLTRSHCNRLTLSWSCRKRMVSGGRGGAHLSGCRGYWGAVNSPHSACLVPLRTSSKIRAVEMRWLSWHKDLRAHVKPGMVACGGCVIPLPAKQRWSSSFTSKLHGQKQSGQHLRNSSCPWAPTHMYVDPHTHTHKHTTLMFLQREDYRC